MTTTLTCDVTGERLDVFIAGRLQNISRTAAVRLLESGCVTLKAADGTEKARCVKKNHKTSAGEEYTVILNEPDTPPAARQDIRLDIVYEDSDVIVINKPRGMVVHPAPGHADGTLVNALLYHCKDSLSGIGGQLRPGIVHRIDKDTSGLLIVAKNDAAHISLSKQLSERTLSRVYEAIVCGVIKNDNGTIDAPIGRHPIKRKVQTVFTVPPPGVKARNAVTHYTVISRYNKFTHIQCRLETGRTHQIRVHLAHIGHPILGDIVYGRKKQDFGARAQYLHARSLRFIHPSTGKSIELTSNLPDYFTEMIIRIANGRFSCDQNEAD